MSDYTPTAEDVREGFSWSGHDNYIPENRKAKRAEFDRWLSEHDQAVIFGYLKALSEKYGKLAIDAREDDMALTAIQFRTTAALLAEEALHLMKGADDE